ncbi:DUF4325 domain-containing protein [Candidatus Woesearchaeota archaeon]|nr:DUF4325 domain-containing protein [Candidatus Woesearchaeota archaeon]
MNTSTKVIIKDKISVDLALRESAKKFFQEIARLSTKYISVDFKGVKSISRSFAHEYITRKKIMKQNISEINVPENVRKMFDIVNEPQDKIQILDIKRIKAVSL